MAANGAHEERAPWRVAVVEHRELERLGIASALQRTGECSLVLDVASGGELLAALRDGLQVDMVLLEMELPGMDGFAVLARLRERYERVRVLAMAHQPMVELVSRAVRQEACTVLCTECSAEALCKAVHDVGATGQHLSPCMREMMAQGGQRTAAPEKAKPTHGPKKRLSPCEMDYWKVHCTLKNPTIARAAKKLGVKYNTARTFRRRLAAKLGVCGSQALLVAGLRAGIAQLDMG